MVLGLKKGQISVFIILGLVLVIGVSLYLYFTDRGDIVPPSVLDAPVAIRPVAQFVTDCLGEAGRDGIIRIGAGGGYIDTQAQGFRINRLEPTESDAVTFGPDAELSVPYWWYLKSPNECTGFCEFSTKRPPLLREDGGNSIETQLDAYVAQSLDACTRNWETLAEQGFSVREQSRPVVETVVGETGVSFILLYPLIIDHREQEYRYERYGTHVQVPLREMYDVASELARIEASTGDPQYYLERHLLQVINSFTGLQPNGLPPIAYATFDLSMGKRWIKSDVQKTVRQLTTAYTPMLQVWGTNNHIFLEAPVDVRDPQLWTRLYNFNMLLVLADNHPNLEVRFSAPDWWREHFDLNCRGQVCAPDAFVNTFGFPFGFQKYNFAYDLSVPVLVEVRDPEAFGGDGYLFQYAIEANIRNNEPFPIGEEFNPWLPGEGFATVEASLLCEPDQRTGTTVTVNVVDSASGRPVDAAITFSCGDEHCAIGSTRDGTLTTQFPRCAGGTVQAISNDRYSNPVSLNTHLEGSETVTISSDAVVQVPTRFTRVQFEKSGVTWEINPSPVQSAEGDQVIVMLERKGGPGDLPFVSSVELCGAVGSDDSLSVARLVPGNYSVSMLALYHDQLVFPVQKHCVDDFCYTIPDEPVVFGKSNPVCDSGDPFLFGGGEYEWELTPSMLRHADLIVFKALVAAIDEVPEEKRELSDMDAVGSITEAARGYQEYLIPEVYP